MAGVKAVTPTYARWHHLLLAVVVFAADLQAAAACCGTATLMRM